MKIILSLKTNANRKSFKANQVRDTFKEYFKSDACALPWQMRYARNTDRNNKFKTYLLQNYKLD